MHPLDIGLSSGNRKIENMCVRKKKVRTHTHAVLERRTASQPNKHTACLLALLSIPFTDAAAAAYVLNSSPSLIYNESHKKKSKENKNHNLQRTKKKNSRFLTNNNDSQCNQYKFFFFFSFCTYLFSIIFTF
jgi:hypothetical protein